MVLRGTGEAQGFQPEALCDTAFQCVGAVADAVIGCRRCALTLFYI